MSKGTKGIPDLPRVEIGEPVTWTPSCFTEGEFAGAVGRLHGRITYINAAHRWFLAEAECFGYTIREGFRF